MRHAVSLAIVDDNTTITNAGRFKFLSTLSTKI